MAGKLKRKRFYAAVSGLFKRQPAFNSPLADNAHNMRVKATVTFEDAITSEPIYDCDEQDQIGEEERSRLVRITITYAQLSAQILLGWFAYFLGSASTDEADQANEVQTIQGNGEGTLIARLVDFEGKTYESKPFAHTATAAQVQAAFEADEAFKRGNIAVTGASLAAGYAIEFTGRFANTNIPTLILVTTGLTTGTANVTQTTAGSNNTHHIVRSSDDTLPYFSFVTGFKMDTAKADKFFNLVADALSLTLNRRRDVGLTVTLIGRLTPTEIDNFTIPPCYLPDWLRGEDVRFLIDDGDILDSEYITDDLFTSTLNFNNSVPTDDDAFPFDDVEVGSLERGEKPTYPITAQVFGSKGDPLHTFAKGKGTGELTVLLGKPSDRVAIMFGKAKFKLASQNRAVFAGTANRSVIPLEITPFGDEVQGAPLRVEGRIDQTAAFLSV